MSLEETQTERPSEEQSPVPPADAIGFGTEEEAEDDEGADVEAAGARAKVEAELPEDDEEPVSDADDIVAGPYNPSTISSDVFEDLVLPERVVDATQAAWADFIAAAGSRDAAGEAVYSAFVDSSPAIQGLFRTPRAVMAIRLMNGFVQMISSLSDPKALKVVVETLGFQHLDLEVTIPRIEVFRKSMLELIEAEIGGRLTPVADQGLRTLFNYAGGAFIYVRIHYAQRLRLLAASWATANKKKLDEEALRLQALEEGGSGQVELDVAEEGGGEQATSGAKRGRGKKAAAAAEAQQASGKANDSKRSLELGGKRNNLLVNASVPTTYNDMFLFNSAVMGFGDRGWMQELLESWDAIVSNVSNTSRFQEECDVLALRLAMCHQAIHLPEYKSVMLATLRSLVKDWGSEHEVAWSWLWGNVESSLKKTMGKPASQQKALNRLLTSLEDGQRDFMRNDLYAKFFAIAPAGQDWFKQSLTRLHYIADQVMILVADMYTEPKRMVEDLSALGLRHVGYGIPTELFGPFVTAYVQVVRAMTQDDEAEEAFRWSISLISRILVRVINEGATVVMNAINTNSPRQLRKAIASAPRSKRAAWMLNVQVGTQSISPLFWAIKSGAVDAAGVIIADLLTIRADRDRYYYAVDDLFQRHPDIVDRLCQDARGLMPVLLDGLVWRSRVVEGNRRRVNYYIKHLLLDDEGHLSGALEAIVDMSDPVIACHPVVEYLSELIWSGPFYWTFLSCKAWLCFTTTIFIIAQSFLAHTFGKNEYGRVVGDRTRTLTFAFRVFVYVFCMGQLAIYHGRASLDAYRRGKTVKVGCAKIPEYLGAFQEYISLIQCICLVFMFAQCPKLYCLNNFYGDYEGHGVLSDFCPEAASVRMSYGILSTTTMFLFFLRLTDLAVLNNTLSAYVIVASRMLQQVALFLFAILFTVLAFTSAVNALFEYNEEYFHGMDDSALVFFDVAFAMFDPVHFEQLAKTNQVYMIVALFVLCVQIFLVNLLIAQIVGEYQATYNDRMGYARMRRIRTIYSIMPYVQAKKWTSWVEGLALDRPLEFNCGDVGFAGGLQITEPASLHPTTEDAILRFGGSPSTPWPLADEDGDDKQGIERLEKLIQRLSKKLNGIRGGKSGSYNGSSGADHHTASGESA